MSLKFIYQVKAEENSNDHDDLNATGKSGENKLDTDNRNELSS